MPSVLDLNAFDPTAEPPVSGTGRARIRYNVGSNIFEQSLNGGAWEALLVSSTPGPHAASHVSGPDTIQSATDSQDGLATSTQITKLDAITGTNTGDEPSASDSVEGTVELATVAETDAGTAADRANTPASMVNNIKGRSLVLGWAFDESIAMADPGAGDIRFNNATPASVTQIAISHTAQESFDVQDVLENMTEFGKLLIVQANDPAKFLLAEIKGLTTSSGTHILIPVSITDSGTIPDGAALLTMIHFCGSIPRHKLIDTPTALSGNQNDWEGGLGEVIRAEASGAPRTVTGFQPFDTGNNSYNSRAHVVTIWNVGATHNILFTHEDAASIVANRFLISGGSTLTLAPNEKVTLTYDPTTLRWRISTGSA